jgi:hypothetical protein
MDDLDAFSLDDGPEAQPSPDKVVSNLRERVQNLRHRCMAKCLDGKIYGSIEADTLDEAKALRAEVENGYPLAFPPGSLDPMTTYDELIDILDKIDLKV